MSGRPSDSGARPWSSRARRLSESRATALTLSRTLLAPLRRWRGSCSPAHALTAWASHGWLIPANDSRPRWPNTPRSQTCPARSEPGSVSARRTWRASATANDRAGAPGTHSTRQAAIVGVCSRRSVSQTARRFTSVIFAPSRTRCWTPKSTSTTTSGVSPRRLTCPPWETAEQVSLRGLTPLVVVEVLFGVQQRVRDGAKITDVILRAVCDTLRREQTPTIAACRVECVPGAPVRSLAVALARHVRRALTDPGRERAGQVWDLGVFGHRGRLSFAGISQPWLAQAVKAWAGEQLPRHRRSGASRVRESVNAVARLSESLRARDDHGLAPESLGRPDIEAFLNRLAYLESNATISRHHRAGICRSVRAAVSGIRGLGLTRPGQAADGLPGDFT